jgi:threonyl-tRNA synthetase
VGEPAQIDAEEKRFRGLWGDRVYIVRTWDYYLEFLNRNANKGAGIRARAMLSDERMNAKIRDAQNQKIPYMLVVGQKEADEDAVSVRYRDGRQENGVKTSDFTARVLERIASKATEP